LTLTNNKLGFLVANGVFNKFIRNEVVGNSTSAGVFLYHTTGSVVQGNTVSNSSPGIFDDGGTNNVIVSNTAKSGMGPENVGILLVAQSDVVVHNTTVANGTGLWVDGQSGGNRLFANTSINNGLDMRDDAAGCDSNLWRANTFVTANQSCIH